MIRARHILPFAFLALTACQSGEVSETLGLNRSAPDEFVVVSRPPLSVPPEFDLTPPRPGEESPHAVSTEQQARKLLLGDSAAQTGGATDMPGAADGTMTLDEFMGTDSVEPTVETAVTPVISSDTPTAASANFLKKLGADSADPGIRQILRTEVAKPKPVKEADSLYEQVVGEEAEETLVDPAKESERLRSNKDAGKPVTEGETPTTDPTPKSFLEKVL